ncbi:hypothetical protein A3A49_00590 [Candidatus Curtissbacteria bacterium RIFCSPLOWO2_01_FULL_38_11b]|uniref:Uncharacterized protein n=1 Tax=Candidatus Curtissbacteria bacterium RIFCSPLOWO2_01_FULL_38_11b TaxID=1797725 RepID=A0A1F5H014_9BACT|nr:MAG: hypothetical protein A3A49_00590 [Candidatus Curtissbacteria bacterium RIFCSPLOWO2_01_FULL_38_11b]
MSRSVSTQDLILDISVNLTRIGDWIADSYSEKKDLIKLFLNQTDEYLSQLKGAKVSRDLEVVLTTFFSEFIKLKEAQIQNDKDFWAEKALTWANILSHRAKLA